MVPRNLRTNLTNTFQLPITQFHRAEPNHSGIDAEDLSHAVLDGGRGIITHDKVVTFVVIGLVFARASWK
jgi:hypothetical protein